MNRSEQRIQAFYLIFESAFQPGDNLIELYDENVEPVCDYAKQLYDGVTAQKESIDAVIGEYSKSWKINRLPKVTLSILRLAVYEITYVDEVPHSVAINEAVELAKKFASKEDSAYINGILGSYSRSLT